MFLQRPFVQKIWLVVLLLTPFVLWLLPANFFDNSKAILCPSRLFFNIECFGCGMTRAIMHLHHFQIEDAIYYNYGSVIIYPSLVVIWAMWVRKALKKLKQIKPAIAVR